MSPRRHILGAPALLVLAAVIAALLVLALVGASGASASGGLSAGGGDSKAGGDGATAPKYARIWERTSKRNKRWARNTAECESGGDPKAIGGGGRYRGAFQFLKTTWRTSPKSPGGDPIDYTYKTQAVVAVALKQRAGTGPWPVCG